MHPLHGTTNKMKVLSKTKDESAGALIVIEYAPTQDLFHLQGGPERKRYSTQSQGCEKAPPP